jgi:hypothetical protein
MVTITFSTFFSIINIRKSKMDILFLSIFENPILKFKKRIQFIDWDFWDFLLTKLIIIIKIIILVIYY